MASTIYTYALTGGKVFPVAFEYLARRFVRITLVGETRLELTLNVDYRFISKTEIETTIVLTPGEYQTLEVRRVTSATDRLVNFTDGSILRSQDLNISQIQAIHIAEEGRDVAENSMLGSGFNWNALGLPIKNVGYPTDPKDAANVTFVADSIEYTLRTSEKVKEVPVDRANKVLAFDANRQPVAIIPATGSSMELELALADPAKGASKIGYKAWWNATQRLSANVYVQDFVPYGFNFGTQDASPWVAQATLAASVFWLPRRINIDEKVILLSDKTVRGRGMAYGGTVVYSRSGNTVFQLGPDGANGHTRITVDGMKFVSNRVPTREKYFIDAGVGAFMNELSNLSFGDVSGVGNQQNGIKLNGTANHITNIRALRLDIEADKPDTTGIAIYQQGVNSFKSLQLETGSRMIMENDRGSSIFGLHMERSVLIMKNATKVMMGGVYAIDGAIEIDDRSSGNDMGAIGGANIRMNDLGMFNKYRQSVGSLAGNGATNFGMDKTYIPLSNVAERWDGAVQNGYKITKTGWHIAVIQCKNTRSNGSVGDTQTGTVEVWNSTTAASLGSKSVSLVNISGIVTPSGAAANSHRTVLMVFTASANDIIQIKGNIVQTASVSPVENTNPLMLNGSAWAVPGAPSLPGESFFTTPVNCATSYDAGLKLTTPPTGSSFSVTQYFLPKTDADLYCVILKGDWPDDTTMSLKVGQPAHDGARQGKIAQSQAIRDSDGRKTLVQYITKKDFMNTAQDRSSVSFGSTLSPGVRTVSLDMCVVFPIK